MSAPIGPLDPACGAVAVAPLHAATVSGCKRVQQSTDTAVAKVLNQSIATRHALSHAIEICRLHPILPDYKPVEAVIYSHRAVAVGLLVVQHCTCCSRATHCTSVASLYNWVTGCSSLA